MLQKSHAQSMYDVLAQLNIPYQHTQHEAAGTMEALQAVEAVLGAPFCKNLFLQNRQGTVFYLLLLSEDKRFRTAEVSKKIGQSRLSFGNEERLFELLGVHPGAITPLGLVFDPEHTVQLLIDEDLRTQDKICIHPCVNTESLCLHTKDLFEIFLPHVGHRPQWLQIDGQVPQE